MIEIRSASGEMLVFADTIDDCIKQLVSLCGWYRSIVENNNRAFAEIAALRPDLSATAPDHVAVFSAGWNACRQAASQIHP